MDNTYKMIRLLKTLSEKEKKEFYKFLISLNCPEKQETLNIQEPSSASHHQDC